MNLRLLKRRAEMLDAVCTGLHPSAVISQLAGKYGVSENVLRNSWIVFERIFQFFGGCKA